MGHLSTKALDGPVTYLTVAQLEHSKAGYEHAVCHLKHRFPEITSSWNGGVVKSGQHCDYKIINKDI